MSKYTHLTPEDDAETAELDRLVDEALRKLIEHADSVKIFVTKPLENGKGETYRLVRGAGNTCATYGLIREWVNTEEGLHARRFQVDDEEDP